MTATDYPLLAGALVIAIGLVRIIERLLDARKAAKNGGGGTGGRSCNSDPPPACLEAIEKVAEAQEQSAAAQEELRDMFKESMKEQREFRLSFSHFIGRMETALNQGLRRD